MEFPEIMEKSWNFILSGKSHWKVMELFSLTNSVVDYILAKFISIEIQNLLHKF